MNILKFNDFVNESQLNEAELPSKIEFSSVSIGSKVRIPMGNDTKARNYRHAVVLSKKPDANGMIEVSLASNNGKSTSDTMMWPADNLYR